uniref:RNB domain-containing protein n=1 Tax=Sphenodon punctatus TaxID=8508 RepID=A0A8D0HT61_SPHPU
MSTIRSDRQLTYEEAQSIIKDRYVGEEPALRFGTLEDCIAVAYHFSRVHRKSRLHEDCYYDQLSEDSSPGNRSSHQMIGEFMIMFNMFVAEYLTNKNSTMNLTPLRCQMEPNPGQMAQLRTKHSQVIPLSIHLSHHLGAQPANGATAGRGVEFSLLTQLWEHLRSAADAGDFHKMLDLIATDDIHPKLAPVVLEFRRLMSRSYFSRSNSTTQSKAGHYNLHVDSYTWASSPIRRYMDLFVQRHLHSVILKKPVLYSLEDIEFLCHDFNRKNGKAQAYEKRAQALQMAAQLKCQVQQKVSFVVGVEKTARNFRALFPLNKETLPDPLVINYRALQLVEQPSFIQERNSMRLTLKRRIYSVTTLKECLPRPAMLWDCNVTLFSAQTWQDILAAIRDEEFERMIDLLRRGRSGQQRIIGRIERSKCTHYVNMSLELSAGDALKLHLTTDTQRGFLVPFVQLWSVTPGFDVCMQHMEKPIDCFSKYATFASKQWYKDTQDYNRVWKPLTAMESASCAVAENDSIVLHDVKIIWAKQRTRKGQLQGTLTLTKDFLNECAIEVDFNHCYLCIRLAGLKLKGSGNNEESLSHGFQKLSLTHNDKLVIDPATYTWVAHGLTEEFGDDEKSERSSEMSVNFYIHFTSTEDTPAEALQDSARFTVELIPKMLPDVRKENALWRLRNASELVKSIALGQRTPEGPLPKSKLLSQKAFNLPGSQRKLNPSQTQAILEALRKPFSLIQGPPGTGKTVVGVHIVYWFHQLNQEKLENEFSLDNVDLAQKCILYCGPSNKSVDVVAGMLLKMRDTLRPLRVYGELIESMEFPYPGSNRHLSRKALRDSKPKSELREIILHYRIRSPPNPYFQQICRFDARVKRGEEITEDEVKEYKKLLLKAREHELKRHNVILCTCTAASASSLTNALHVKQVLVDECAMSTEPETFIPLVSYKKVDKVVLLGDHKQLRPVVNNDFCKSLGMETSLFERYREQAWMLDTQYRMHKDICRFPSEEFYHGKLKTGPNLNYPRSAFCHRGSDCCSIIFGHIEGKEQYLMISTEEGNENSRANLEEVEQVVSNPGEGAFAYRWGGKPLVFLGGE